MFSSIIFVLTLAVAAVTSTSISIAVGENGALAFNPNTTTAAIGDLLEFHFYNGSGPHSVVKGIYDQPCMPSPDSFFSDYITGSSTGNETYIISVETISPIWFYCSAHKHCEAGMVGVINPPSNVTLAGYAAAAKNAPSNVAPASIMVDGTVTTLPASAMTGTCSLTTTRSSTTVTDTATGAAGASSKKGSSVATVSVVGGASSTKTGIPVATVSAATGTKHAAVAIGFIAAGGLVVLMG